MDVNIVNEHYNKIESSADNPGIIAIRSNTVTAGYWNEPELTANVIQDRVIYMTDLGYIEDGYLYLVGHWDDVINVGGLKIAPTEVDDIAIPHPVVNEWDCIPYDDVVYGRVVKLLVPVNEGYEFKADQLADFWGSSLRRIRFLSILTHHRESTDF